MRQFAQAQGGQRRERGGLEHHAIAGRQGRRGFPAGDGKGKFHGTIAATTPIGWRSVKSNPPRATGMVWPQNLPDRARVILEHARAQRDFVARIGDRFADLHAFQLRHPLEVLAQDARDAIENFAAFARASDRASSAPRPAGPTRRRRPRPRRVGGGDLGKGFLGGGIDEGRSVWPEAARGIRRRERVGSGDAS